jgi:mRNA interferase MazF
MRPCVIISPNQINYNINTVIIAPMTTATKDYPTRVAVVFNNKNGQVVLDQIRTVDKTRLIRKEGELTEECAIQVLNVLTEMFIL